MVLNIGAQQTDFYPRPPRGGRPLHALCLLALSQISIHALREEGDAPPSFFGHSGGYFYPRPPRGGRLAGPLTVPSLSKFLSTPSARRATHRRGPQHRPDRHFYPRPPRGGRPN